jgi:hypothetical protein
VAAKLKLKADDLAKQYPVKAFTGWPAQPGTQPDPARPGVYPGVHPGDGYLREAKAKAEAENVELKSSNTALTTEICGLKASVERLTTENCGLKVSVERLTAENSCSMKVRISALESKPSETWQSAGDERRQSEEDNLALRLRLLGLPHTVISPVGENESCADKIERIKRVFQKRIDELSMEDKCIDDMNALRKKFAETLQRLQRNWQAKFAKLERAAQAKPMTATAAKPTTATAQTKPIKTEDPDIYAFKNFNFSCPMDSVVVAMFLNDTFDKMFPRSSGCEVLWGHVDRLRAKHTESWFITSLRDAMGPRWTKRVHESASDFLHDLLRLCNVDALGVETITMEPILCKTPEPTQEEFRTFTTHVVMATDEVTDIKEAFDYTTTKANSNVNCQAVKTTMDVLDTPVLIIEVNRSKESTNVINYTTPIDIRNRNYTLSAVVCLRGGHYTAFVWHDNMCYYYDDILGKLVRCTKDVEDYDNKPSVYGELFFYKRTRLPRQPMTLDINLTNAELRDEMNNIRRLYVLGLPNDMVKQKLLSLQDIATENNWREDAGKLGVLTGSVSIFGGEEIPNV